MHPRAARTSYIQSDAYTRGLSRGLEPSHPLDRAHADRVVGVGTGRRRFARARARAFRISQGDIRDDDDDGENEDDDERERYI